MTGCNQRHVFAQVYVLYKPDDVKSKKVLEVVEEVARRLEHVGLTWRKADGTHPEAREEAKRNESELVDLDAVLPMVHINIVEPEEYKGPMEVGELEALLKNRLDIRPDDHLDLIQTVNSTMLEGELEVQAGARGACLVFFSSSEDDFAKLKARVGLIATRFKGKARACSHTHARMPKRWYALNNARQVCTRTYAGMHTHTQAGALPAVSMQSQTWPSCRQILSAQRRHVLPHGAAVSRCEIRDTRI